MTAGRTTWWRHIAQAQPRHVAAVAGAMLLWFIGAYASDRGGDLTTFICFGDQFFAAADLPPGTHILSNSAGYDGQFFYAIARDPLARGDWHQHLDSPAYRYASIGLLLA